MRPVASLVLLLILTRTAFAAFDGNLLFGGKFPAVLIQGEGCAAHGWRFYDHSRYLANRNESQELIDGRKCMQMHFFPGGMTFQILPGQKESYYTSYGLYNISTCLPPAPSYRVSGKIQLDQGQIQVPLAGLTFDPDLQWQKFSVVTQRKPDLFDGEFSFWLKIRPGMQASLAEFCYEPVYPGDPGVLRLADGGLLQRIVVADDAGQLLRNAAQLLRGWLWQLSGTAIRLDSVPKPVPEPGTIVLQKKPGKEGSFAFRLNAGGGELSCQAEYLAPIAVFEYLRLCGVRYYGRNNKRVPERTADFVFPTAEISIQPRFSVYNQHPALGGVNPLYYAGSAMADWYAEANRVRDHMANFMVPYLKYSQSHPEYVMLDKSGKRWASSNLFRLVLCSSNAEVRRIAGERILDAVADQPWMHEIPVTQGDSPLFCHCPACRQLDPEPLDQSSSDVHMDFVNAMAGLMQEKYPGKYVSTLAYTAAYEEPPRKILLADNVIVEYCLWGSDWPCAAHVDCELNQRGVENLRGWSTLTGPERLRVTTYSSLPFHQLRLLEFLNQSAKSALFMHTGDEILRYLAGRWNLGGDGEDAMQEFCEAYYGSGGEKVVQVFRLIDEYCRNYQHTAEELASGLCTVRSSSILNRSILSRAVFDQIHRLLEEAVSAGGDLGGVALANTLDLRIEMLRCDLIKFPRSECVDKTALAEFAGRMASLIRNCQRLFVLNPKSRYLQELAYRCPARDFLLICGGLTVQQTIKDWSQEPDILKFLQYPVAAIYQEMLSLSGGGLRWFPGSLFGGSGIQFYRSPGGERKHANIIRRPESGQHLLTGRLHLEEPPVAQSLLILEGLDDEKDGAARLEVRINGNSIFAGENIFSESSWSRMAVAIPPGLLKRGSNTVELVNQTAEKEVAKLQEVYQDGAYQGQEKIQDFKWGWMAVSDLLWLDLNGEFVKMLEGESSSWKEISGSAAEPQGEINAVEGSLMVRSRGAGLTGVNYVQGDSAIPLNPGDHVRMSLQISGKGTVSFGCWAYSSAGHYLPEKCRGKGIKLPEGETDFQVDFDTGEGVASLKPYVALLKESECRIHHILLEFQFQNRRAK